MKTRIVFGRGELEVESTSNRIVLRRTEKQAIGSDSQKDKVDYSRHLALVFLNLESLQVLKIALNEIETRLIKRIG